MFLSEDEVFQQWRIGLGWVRDQRGHFECCVFLNKCHANCNSLQEQDAAAQILLMHVRFNVIT